MFGTFVAAGDRPFILTPEQIRANLLRFTFNGQRIFKEEQPEYRRVLDELADAPLADLGETLRKPNLARLVVTDDNMATEFKQQPWSSPAFGWMAFYQRRWPQGILQFLRQRSRR